MPPIIQLLAFNWPLVITGVVGFYILSNRYKNGLSRIPGPILRSFSSLPRLISVYQGQSQNDDIALHNKYGPIVRLAPGTISISDPEEIQQIYGVKTRFYKSRFFELSSVHDEEGLVPDPFVLADKEIHSRMKRNAANAYSLNGLIQIEPWIEPVTVRLLSLLERRYVESGEVCDLGELLQHYAMDAVFSLTFGKDMKFMEDGDKLRLLSLLKFFANYMAIFGQIPWMHKYLLGNELIGAKMMEGDMSNMEMMALAERERDAAKANPNTFEDKPKTFLQQLLDNQQKNPDSITDREIMTHATGNIAAGSDTTAIAMRSTIYHLLKNPETYDRLCKEVRGSLALPVSYRNASELPYLNAVIKEAMRIHPSVGMILARTVPEGGAVICGHPIKSGTEVGINPWVLHRDPKVFPDPDRFMPERWLTEDKDHLASMRRSFFAFGGGAHTCSGRHISIMETTKLIPSLLLKFDFELAPDIDRAYGFSNLWFTPQHGLKVLLKHAKLRA